MDGWMAGCGVWLSGCDAGSGKNVGGWGRVSQQGKQSPGATTGQASLRHLCCLEEPGRDFLPSNKASLAIIDVMCSNASSTLSV
mmetsp:Transcript_38367/g.109640  ORF Transcript_38367/g.109640 Transcript_38367/m.109640 type:complete len:84 (-) Transcript_38367:1154-1405(-)